MPNSASPGSPGPAGQEPGRPSILPPTGSENSAKKEFHREKSNSREYVNPPADGGNANLAVARGDVTSGLPPATSSNGAARALRNWADCPEDQGPGADDDFTVVRTKKRRRESANSPTAAAPSSNIGGARTSRRPQSSAGSVPRAQEIRTTRAHITEARARQASSSEDHCVYLEHGPELQPFHYLRALDRMLGGTAGVIQVSKVNGHQLLGLANRGLAERLINEGLEVEGTLLRAFPFRKRAERITVGNLPFFVEDSAIISALKPYGRVTSIAPKLMKAGPYTYNDGRREAFIVLREGMTTERLPTRLEIPIKGEAWPAYLSSGIKCSRCHGQGHRRANCPLLAGRTNAPGPATPISPTGVPPVTAPGLPRQPSAHPPPPASPSPAMETPSASPAARAVTPSAAPRPSTPVAPAVPVEMAPPAPPPVTPAPSLRAPGGSVSPQSTKSGPPAQDIEMTAIEESSASSTSSSRTSMRDGLVAFIQRSPTVSFTGTDALDEFQKYVNPPAGGQHANPAAPTNFDTASFSEAAAQANRSWADLAEDNNPEHEDNYTTVQRKKRRRGSAESPAAAAPSSNIRGAGAIRRPRSSTGWAPRAEEIRTTRAHIAEARARQASSTEDHCVYVERSPELEPFHYMRAIERMFGSTREVFQVTKMNGHFLVGLANRGMAERLVNEGLEVEGTLHRAFPFRKRAERITVGNLPFFVGDATVISALSAFGRVTSIAPKLMKAGPYIYNDGRREAFIILREGMTIEGLPTRLNITIKGEAWPAYLSSGIRCSRCRGQGHRRANCPLLAGRTNAPGPATPTSPTSVPPVTAPGLPQQPSAHPTPPASSSPAMEIPSASPAARAVTPSAAPRPSTPVAPAVPVEMAPPAPPPVTPAPSLRAPGGSVSPQSTKSGPPAQDIEMTAIEESSASSTSSSRTSMRDDLVAFIQRSPTVSFTGTDALGLGREEVLDLLSSRTKAQRKRGLLTPPQTDALAGLIEQILGLKPAGNTNVYKILHQVKSELKKGPVAVPPTPPLPAPRPAGPTPPVPHGVETKPAMATPPPPLPTPMEEEYVDHEDLMEDLFDELNSDTELKPLLDSGFSTSPGPAGQEPGRPSILSPTGGKNSLKDELHREISRENSANKDYANPPTGVGNANLAVARGDVTSGLPPATSSNGAARALRNWADCPEDQGPGADDDFTVVRTKKRRRESANSPTAAAPSSNIGGARTSRRLQSSAGSVPRAQEVRTTRAHITEARARQASSSEDHCVYLEHGPELQPFHYLRALDRMLGGTAGVIQVSKARPGPLICPSGIKCSRCHGQGHRRANCPLLAGRTNAPRPATPISPTSVPPVTAPGLPRQPSAHPPPPASPSPAMETPSASPAARAVTPSAAPRPSTPVAPAVPVEMAPPAPPPVTPAPSLRAPGGSVSPQSTKSGPPAQDIEMTAIEESSASSTSSSRTSMRDDLVAFIQRSPTVSFTGTDALGLGREEVLDLLSSRTKAQRKRGLLTPPQTDALAGLIEQILGLKPAGNTNVYKILHQVKSELKKGPAAVPPTPPLPAPRPAGPTPPVPHGVETKPAMATPPPPLPTPMEEVDHEELMEDLFEELSSDTELKPLLDSGFS
ncbi:hypothetical protein LAZ67_7000069, partial [Cordylochernes scorpioides]